MQINRLTDHYAVSPQITPADVPTLAEAGFAAIICNRPDIEVDSGEDSAAIRAAAMEAGLAFHDNPVTNGAMTGENVELQGRVLEDSAGPVFAYCRTGNRCTVVWALSQAGHMPTDDIVGAAARAGYDISALRPQIEAMAAQR